MKNLILPLTLIFLSSLGCESDPSSPPPVQPADMIENGVYILNEGDFADPEGARLSLYDIDRDTVYRDVYEGSNGGTHLGNLGDDLKILDDRIYILMSGSENLSEINLADHTLLRGVSFPGSSPHDLLIDPARNRAYVTRLFSSSVLVLDFGMLTAIDTIIVGANPQEMLLINDYLFICNSGYGSDRTVSVIHVQDNSIDSTLILSDGPTEAVLASDGRVWVSCSGNAFGFPPTLGKVYMINPATLAIEDSVLFQENLWGAIASGVDGNVYVLGVDGDFGGPVHRITPSTRLVTEDFIPGTFYAMGVDPVTGDLYLSDARGFASDGEVSIFESDGTYRARFTAQKGPGAFAFKR